MKFLKTLAATTLGVLLAIFILVILFVLFIIGISNFGGPSEPSLTNNTVLEMNIRGSLPARSLPNAFGNFFNSSSPRTVSLQMLRHNLKKARADSHIKGVVLNINNMTEGWSNLQEAYQAISQFSDSSHKFIYAKTTDSGINEKGYYLASATDSVFAPPQSFFEFDGLYTQVTFYKGLMDKLGVKAEIARHGKYKSAVAPYFRKKMSAADKQQLGLLLDETSNTFLKAASRKSGQTVQQLNNLLNEAPHLSAKFGYQHGLIDSLMYTNQLDSLIKKRMGLKQKQSFETISGARFASVSDKSAGLSRPKAEGTIGVIYANGPIMNGRGSSSRFGRQSIITAPWFRKQLQHITDNNQVKALVIRINTPGGSGSASDAIWNMIRQVRKKMPVIVSIGPVDASGGYYISAAADSIVAEPTTITGSIGVFALNFDAKQFFNDKLGITFDDVKSNKHADWMSPTRGFDPSEKEAFKANITEFYHSFLSKVAQGRGMTVDEVNKIAQGRVWSGRDAQKHNLVDVLGGLPKALQIAAKAAGLKHYQTDEFPKPQTLYEQLVHATNYRLHSALSEIFMPSASKQLTTFRQRIELLHKRGALLLFPYHIRME